MSNSAIDDFVNRAKAVTVTEAAERLGVPRPKGESSKAKPWSSDRGQPCPACGGNDRFSINGGKQVWNCRQCGGGRTGISLAGLVGHYKLSSRAGFLDACAAALGESVPEGGERETEQERREREARAADAAARAERDRKKNEREQDLFRERQVRKARDIYFGSTVGPNAGDGPLREYLRLRTGFSMPDAIFEHIRFNPRLTYWSEERDERGHQNELYSGYGMVAPFVDLTGRVTGCHQTWIDLKNGPKFRPAILDEKGEPAATKKMRGTKKGSLVPVCGDFSARRWVGGEGIENVIAIAGGERFRADTFYFATGDLGNLAGPADTKSSFPHPYDTFLDAAGRVRAVRVPGPRPRAEQAPTEAYQVPDHVTEIVHLADGDSEPVFTASAMARAEARLARDGREIETWWPPQGQDFSVVMSSHRSQAGMALGA